MQEDVKKALNTPEKVLGSTKQGVREERLSNLGYPKVHIAQRKQG